MAKSRAYTKEIVPNGGKGSVGEENLVHQASPSWVLTFIRWDVRDTLRAIPTSGTAKELLAVRDPLVVENDCVQLSVAVNKSVLTHSMNATLLETDTNYETAICVGDFVFVNILDWPEDSKRIAKIAGQSKPGAINKEKDGFKGVFKIQSVRKKLSVDPGTGTRQVFYSITGFAFTEFNNILYYNPYLKKDNQGSAKDDLLFVSNLQSDYAQMISTKNNPPCQDLIRDLIKSFLGTGISDRGQSSAGGLPVTTNTHFYIPGQVGSLLGVSGAKAAKDVYNYLFGLQKYGNTSKDLELGKGTNPSNVLDPKSRFYYTSEKCPGQSLLKAEYWNQVNAWSILNQYTNAPVNELYTTVKISPEGNIMPTVVFRQIPFTSDLFGKEPFDVKASVTEFLTLPRWKISPAMVIGTDLGREEAARLNFVQYYTMPTSDIKKPEAFISAQTAAKNYAYDINDVKRSGLKPYIVSTSFEDLTITKDAKLARKWALIVGDAVIGGHLKFNGTIECVGIVDPIAVGDNLEYDRTVYHIEEITHSCGVNPESGMTNFRTIIKVSHGVSIATASTGLSYPEMTYTNAYGDRLDNYSNGNQTLPGVSEEQDILSREKSPAPTKDRIKRRDKAFAQPGKKIAPVKDDE